MTSNQMIPPALLCLILLPHLACDETTQPPPPGVIAFQVPGCQQSRAAGPDSCFSYDFRDVLLVDFCAPGNCCPDSDRFSFRHAVSRDTITVTIADTAAQLCRCTCSYVLRMAFDGLPGDEYLFLCRREDYLGQAILYSRTVRRQ